MLLCGRSASCDTRALGVSACDSLCRKSVESGKALPRESQSCAKESRIWAAFLPSDRQTLRNQLFG